MATSTPGDVNSLPRVGPIVISEIMYHPPTPDAEYIELTNISTQDVTLFDFERDAPWRITKGFTYVFSSTDPVTMIPGQRVLLLHNRAAILQAYDTPANMRIIQWDAGSLDNSGETLELSQPGDLSASGVRKYIQEDRVRFVVESPWPTGPNGGGTALGRIDERAYGNDVANWMETDASPG